MPNQKSNKYDLEERTAKFGEDIIRFCKKESRESKHFIRMMVVAVPSLREDAKPLWQEAKEINLIFNTIYKKVS